MSRKRLGEKAGRVVLVAELYRRQRGEAPIWGELRHACRIDSRAQFFFLTRELRDQGHVTFDDDTPQSLRVNAEALSLAIALSKKGQS